MERLGCDCRAGSDAAAACGAGAICRLPGGSARGAVIAVLAEHDLPIFEYAPRRVKQSICGFGNASKQQVALLVSQFLSISTEQIALDSTDALALALCHAQDLTVAQGLNLPSTI